MIRVVVVEPRSLSRARLVHAIEADGDVTVVGQCEDGDGAVVSILELRPDLVVVVGGADPATAPIETIMAYAPTPVLVVKRGNAAAVDDARELAAGAVCVLPWPTDRPAEAAAVLRQRVRVLQGIVVVRHPRARLRGSSRPTPASAPLGARRGRLIGMAASTGGPHTLSVVLAGLDDIDIPVLVVQHIHTDFVDGLAGWLAKTTGRRTVIARDGALPEPGVVHLAPGGRHLTVTAEGRMALRDDPPALHRPSANELFKSMAAAYGRRAVGVLLTGMGDDGAAGLLAIHRAGGITIVQDGASSTIDGMPRAARELGAASVIAPLGGIADAVLGAAGERAS